MTFLSIGAILKKLEFATRYPLAASTDSLR